MLSLRSKRTLDSQKRVFNAFRRKTSLGAPAELCSRTAKYSSWVLDIKKKQCSLKLSKQWRIQEFFHWGWGQGGPSYDVFAFACKAVFPAPKEIGVHRLRNTWSSLLSQLVDNYGDNSVDNWLFSINQSNPVNLKMRSWCWTGGAEAMDGLMSDERLSGLALIRTYTMTLTMTLTKSVQSFLPNTRGGCFKGQRTEL